MTAKEQMTAIESQITTFKEQLGALIVDKAKEGFEAW